jgi:exonuclease III
MIKHSNKCNSKTFSKNTFKIFHQNIRGLKNKHNELLCHLQEFAPHVLCLTEHHLDGDQISHLNLDSYTSGALYCTSRRFSKMGGTCIYVQDNLNTVNIMLDNYCYDKDIEACAVSANIDSLKICILTIYRSPSSIYDIFFIKLELILQTCRNNAKVFVCGDFNVNNSDNCHK